MKTPVNVYCYTWDLDEKGHPRENATLSFRTGEHVPCKHSIRVGSGTVDFTIDEKPDVVAQQVAAIDIEIETTKGDYYRRLGELEDEKKQLLSLEFTPSPLTPENDMPF